MNIKVLGGGCKSCEALLASAKEAVAKKGIDAEIEYITEYPGLLQVSLQRDFFPQALP